ncbi:MAG: hypothetical protein WC369_02105 [Dehalococcoidales bacterium]|jgi:hypothetical protein
MFETTISLDKEKLDQAIRLIPGQLKVELSDGMDHISRKFLKLFYQTRLKGPPGIKARSHGIFTHFQRSSLVVKNILDMGMSIAADSQIAKMHEEGATLTNPSGAKLAVPLSARKEMYTATGLLKKAYKHPRSLKNVVPIKFKGETYLTKVKKKSRDILPLFVLKNFVKIQPRLGFYATWESNQMQVDSLNILNKSVENALRKV